MRAKRSRVKTFYHLDINFETNEEGKPVAVYSPHRYRDTQVQISEFIDGKIRDFPFIFQGNGEPWEIGNLYLISKFNEDSIYKRPSVDSYKAFAGHIADFRRWIESVQDRQKAEDPEIGEKDLMNEFYFPRFKGRRVTYRYRTELVDRCKKGVMSWTTASNRINSIVDLYKNLQELYPEKFIYPPYDVKDVLIQVRTSFGVKKVLKQTTDLMIAVSKIKSSEEGMIMDGGERLRPLNINEQEIINKHLSLMNNYTFQLILWVMLYTGARMQTALTLTVRNIRRVYSSKRLTEHGDYILDVGAGTDVDVKFHSRDNKRQKLHVNPILMERLIEYADSTYARECREKSFYGDVDENYLFLSSKGNAYYTSSKELKDRNDPTYSKRVHPHDAVSFPIAKGDSVRQWVKALIKHIQKEHPDFRWFRPHDLRATFGMNYVRHCLNSGCPEGDILNDLAYRMGHKDPQTTMIYLRFDQLEEYKSKVQDSHSDQVHEIVNKYGLKMES